MISKNSVYVKLNQENLQVFFAVLAYIEKYSNNYLFIIDNHNFKILTECRKIIYFDYLICDKVDNSIEKISINIDHREPNTEIKNYHNSPLIFPRLLKNNHYKNFNEKYDIIYFRGQLTKSRVLETLNLFMEIFAFKALAKLIVYLVLKRREFIISTPKVYFCFSSRGRDPLLKFYDIEYYNEMTNYKYVFCPRGDFLWTYRFFETIQLGGLPISNYNHKIFEGFLYCRRKNKSSNLQEITNSNFLKFSRIFYIN